MVLVLLTVVLAGCAAAPGAWRTPVPPSPGPTTGSPAPAPKPHTLVFDATGTATLESVDYTVDGRDGQELSVKLPWRKSFSLPPDGRQHRWSLTIHQRGGTMTLVVTLDGNVVTRSDGYGEGTADLSGSITG